MEAGRTVAAVRHREEVLDMARRPTPAQPSLSVFRPLLHLPPPPPPPQSTLRQSKRFCSPRHSPVQIQNLTQLATMFDIRKEEGYDDRDRVDEYLAIPEVSEDQHPFLLAFIISVLSLSFVSVLLVRGLWAAGGGGAGAAAADGG